MRCLRRRPRPQDQAARRRRRAPHRSARRPRRCVRDRPARARGAALAPRLPRPRGPPARAGLRRDVRASPRRQRYPLRAVMRSCRAWIRDANRLNSTMNHSPPAGADGSTARRPTAAAGGPAAGPFPPRNRCARANPVRSNRSGARHGGPGNGAFSERSCPARKWGSRTAADRCGRDPRVRKTRRSQEGRWASTSGRESAGVKWPRQDGGAPGLLSTGRPAVASLPRPEAHEEESPGAPLHRVVRRPFRSFPPSPLPPLPLRAPARRLLSGPPAPRRAGRRRGRREERGRPGGAPGDRRPRTPLRRPGARRRR